MMTFFFILLRSFVGIQSNSSLLRIKSCRTFTQARFGAGRGGRTLMPLRARDFKSLASANSAIPAKNFTGTTKTIFLLTTGAGFRLLTNLLSLAPTVRQQRRGAGLPELKYSRTGGQ